MREPIIYIRTSTDEQTPELQLRDIVGMIQGEVPEILAEQKSAWKENVKRPVLDQLMKMVRKNQVSEVYVWDLDRIYRNRKRLQEFFILCRTFDVKIHSFNQNWLEEINKIPAPFNEIVLDLLTNFLGWIGEEESTKKSKRVKMAVVRKAKGTFSYKGNKWGRKEIPTQTVNRVLELSSQGLSIRKICAEVKIYNEDPSNGRNISIGSVHKIIDDNRQKILTK